MAILQEPQLIFTAGPEQGRVVTLDAPSLLMGRSPAAQVRVNETYASREHAQFVRTPDGVVVEVLSGRGMEIAGKTFKKGKQVLLGTGDVLKVGRDTEIVFVAGGDDPAPVLTALDGIRQAAVAAPADAKARQEAAREEARQEEQARKAAQAAQEEQEDPKARKPSALQPGEIVEMERRRRKQKIYVGLGIYLGLMFIVFLALKLFARPDVNTRVNRPPQLTQEQIERYVQQVNEELFPSPTLARDSLSLARESYAMRTVPGRRFETIRQYNLYRGYRGSDVFETVADQNNYSETLDELVTMVRGAYDQACIASKQERWQQAREGFEQVRTMVPDPRNPVYQNVMDHLEFVRKMDPASKKKGYRFK